MEPTVDSLVRGYAQFEIRLHRTIAGMSGAECAQCPTPCCESRHCSDLLQSPWLMRVARSSGADLEAARQGDGLCFLERRGCTLSAGRPLQCTAYVCDRLSLALRAPLDAFLYHALASLLPMIVRNVHGREDLIDVEDPSVLTPAQRKRLADRLATGRQCLDAVDALIAARRTPIPPDRMAEPLLLLARTTPFAARHVRLPGEPLDVSRASLRPA